MASTRTKTLARFFQRANPGMKYTEALRHAEQFYEDVPAGHMPVLDEGALVMATMRKPSAPQPHLDPFSWTWDGETHPDPLTFIIGRDLETGEVRHLTLDGDSPHLLVSGATATGKTNLAEIIAAQTIKKSMPWDPHLRGSAVIVDPKGPLAHRWVGRPGVIAVDGHTDAVVPGEDGESITGPAVMAAAMQWVEEEHQRRQAVLAQHEHAASWLDLPDVVKRKERLAPMVVILDDYLDHADHENDDAAHGTITNLANWHARKYRTVGMHTVLISQKIDPSTIGSSLARSLPVRVMTGQASGSQLRAAFGDADIPDLPSAHGVAAGGGRGIERTPGCARLMVEPGHVETIQIPRFSGLASDALSKWFPRDKAPANGGLPLPRGFSEGGR